MSLLRILPLGAVLIAQPVLSAGEEWVEKTLRYELDGTTFESTLVYDGSEDEDHDKDQRKSPKTIQKRSEKRSKWSERNQKMLKKI